ncbi:hypothetical protein [Streptomyces anulatus]|uniref:hypothetical protein n=1 Tax=Streptomyces anulatus TaxID=1892 RepID=UPI00386BD39C|nr:hypothetical protein OHB50_39210 [Streptomyces anulatus]
MLNRLAADAESQDLDRDTETKAVRRAWNPALHPRDHKGRFIETGGVVRLWGGKRAVVRRALPNDRILVQDAGPDGEFTGRKHTTSAKWVTMLTRPDGSAPTDDQDKVAAEDERRLKDPQRGNGVARDDDGDPSTPNEPHDLDDQGQPIGDDDGDGPEDDDDQDEPADGSLPVNRDALPNTQHAAGARFTDTAAVRAHFTQLADRPGQRPEMARFLRAVADDEDLQTTPSGRLAVLRDDSTNRWYLTAIGTGQRMEAAGDFDSAQDAARFAAHLDASVLASAPFDFSDPDLDQAARGWRSSTGENIQAAIVRARQEHGTQAPPARPTAPRKTAAARPSTGANRRFSTVSSVRTHWTGLRDRAAASPDGERSVQSLDELLATERIKLTGDGQFVVAKLPNGRWQLIATGSGMPLQQQFAKQRDAQDFAQQFIASPPRGRDGTPLDLSDPGLSVADWRSEDNRSLAEVLGGATAAPEQAPTTAPAPTTATANGPSDGVPRADLKPGDRIKVTVRGGDVEWPESTRDRTKPETVIVEGTVAPGYRDRGRWMPLVDATLTDENRDVLASGEGLNLMSMPAMVTVTERGDGVTSERIRADRVRVGDVVADGGFGQVVTDVRRFRDGRSLTVRSLGPSRMVDGFSLKLDHELDIIPKARRRPEDVQRDVPGRTNRHADSADARRAASLVLSDWGTVNELAEQQWADKAPEAFRTLTQHMQNVTDSPQGAEGYQQNAEAMRGALTAVDGLDTEGVDADLLEALHRLEEHLDANADRFDADAHAITANKQKRREQELQSRPPVEDLDDAQLRAEYDELIAGDLGTAGETRLEDIKRERRDRDKRAITDREAPESLSTSDLRGEQLEFARNRTSYEPDDVAEVRRQRMAAVNAELERRETGESTDPTITVTETSAPEEPLRHAWDDPDQFITVTMPEILVGFLYDDQSDPMVDPDTRKALTESVAGPNGTRKITGPVAVHRALLAAAWTLEGGEGLESDPGEVQAYRDYAKRIDQADAKRQSRKPKTGNAPSPADGNENPNGTVTLTPDEVTEQLNAVRPSGSKAPSSMSNDEIRDEAVTLMEREMANGGELTGADRTRLRVLEAEEARRAGRAPKREETKPKPPVEEPGGLFDTEEPAAPQTAADLNNPDDRPADAFGTPDLFAAAEGRDTTGLRPPQMRVPEDLAVGDRFLDADGRTHVVDQAPVRTGRGRVRVISGDGRNHFFARDIELRVLYPDETAPEPTGRDATTPAPAPDAAPTTNTPGEDAPEAPNKPEDPESDAPAAEEPNAAPDQIRIEHTGTSTVVRFPGPNGRADDEEFELLRSLGFKRSRTQKMFYLPSTWTLSTRDERVRRLKERLDRRNTPYEASTADSTDGAELSEEQRDQLTSLLFAPLGTWALTDFRPGDEVWTGSDWDRIDSVGPKNVRLQRWGTTAYDRILARRRGDEIRTALDAPADDGTPRPGVDDPERLSDPAITAELERLRAATLPEGTDPVDRTVRRQVAARIRALTDQQSARTLARRRAEAERRDQAALVRDPARLAAMKAQQVQGRDGAPIGIVYQQAKGKWRFVDRDGRMVSPQKPYPTRAAAINAANTFVDRRNERAGEGWKYASWDDAHAGDTVRVPELSPSPTGHGRQVTGWSEPFEVTEVRRGDTGQVFLSGRRGDEDITLEIRHTDATFGTSKPGVVPEREPSDAGSGMFWQQMQPEDFGQDAPPSPTTANPEAPRPPDEYGTPDLIVNGMQPQAAAGDEVSVARTIRNGLPELPPLPNLGGLSRQDKDDVRRIRSDYANIVRSLDGILAGEPPTGDTREDLRRVRNELEYVSGRLNEHLLPGSDQAQDVRRKLFDLREQLDQAVNALPERAPQPQGDGPNGGTLYHPWDVADGDLVRFDAENPADRERSLASYYGTYRGDSSSATGEQGRTLVTYQSLQWNDDRQQWENDDLRHTVTMPPRGLVERFTEEEWNTWRRPNSAEPETAAPEDREEAPPAPIGEQAGRDLDDAAIDAELQALQEWQNRHVRSSGEGPHVQGSLMLALRPVANRRAELNEVQRERLNAERQRQQREEKARRKTEALGRALIGKRNANGTYPVSVDDREIGTVRQLGRQWMFKHEDGSESGLEHPTRGDAVAALVELDDRRQKEEIERGEQEEARRQTPAGWVHGDRDELAENDIIRVPVTRNDREGRPYPVRWRDPVRVRSVERLSNDTTMVSVENLDGSRSDVGLLMLENTEGDAGFTWRQGRTRPEPTPAWRHELRNRMADIGDDIATLHRLEGFEDQERIGALADLIQRVENHRSPDLPGDLRSIVAETAWLEGQFDNPNLDLPYETSSRRSWATAANRKAQSALANPDFQQIPPEQDSTGNPAWTWDLGDGVWIDRPRSEGSPNGPTGGPRNVYVGGRIEGLIGRERPRGNYFWWRPGGQTGEGRYASAEDAARGFARDLRETDLPSLSARRADDEFNRPNPGDSNSQTGGEETSAEPTGGFVTDGVTANADVAAHMTEIASLHDAVRALGIDPGLARQYWEQARTAFAEDNPRMGLFRLQDAERHAWHEIRRLEAEGANSDAIEALKTWAVSMNHARVRMTSTPGPGERYVTYGELRPGDVLRWPYVNGYAVWGEPTYPQAPPDHELWVNPMHLDGQSSNSQMPYPRTNLALVSDDSEAIDAARQALLVRRAADEEALANRRRELEAARAERAEAERPAVEGELVEPGNLAVGNEVNVSGRNNRGQDRTWRGRLLAEPRRVTVQRGGQQAEAWRLHIGEEGQKPTLGNMLTVGVDERVDRIGTPNRRTEERDAPGRAGDDDERNRGDGDPADSSVGPEASEDSNREQREDNGREEQRNRRRGNDRDGEAGGPDGGSGGGSGGDGPGAPDMPDSTGEGNGLNRDADDEERKRRRRRRGGGNGNGGSGGSGRPGGPGLPHLNLPDSDSSVDTRSPAGDSGGGEGDPAPRPRARRTSIDDQRQAWSTGEDLTPGEDIPERRAHLAQLAARDGLALSGGGGLVMWPEPQPDGGTNWRFAQARTGNRLANITLTSSDPEEARALAGRFEEIADANGDVFDWNAQLDRSTVAQWRDGEGRNLPDALLAVREDYQQERQGAFALPDDLTGLTDDELAAAYGNGLSPSDTMRLMAEMDRRDDTDQRIRAAVPDTPPADAEEAERRGRAMDEALGFGDTDVTRPAPATPGRLRREFDALDEERFAAAMQETGGTFFNADSQDSDVDPRALFSGRSVTAARARELASDELREWFDRNGGRLTYATYSQRERDRVLRAEFAEIDEARYRAAEDATNGYFFRRQHDGGVISDRELFSGGSLSQFDRWRDLASEELRDWFDANGGRMTFNQYKNTRRADDRAARDLYEEELRRSADGSNESEAPDAEVARPASIGNRNDENFADQPGGARASQADGADPARGEPVALRDLRPGDIIQALHGDDWHVVLSPPGDRTQGNDLWLDTWSLDRDGGSFGFYPADQIFTRNGNPDLVDRGRPVLDAQVRLRADNAAANDRRRRSAAQRAAQPPQQPSGEAQPDVRRTRRPVTDTPGTAVHPSALAEGDAVRVTGRNNRGATVTFEGRLLTRPDETTARRDGSTVPVWRLHVGEEGDALRPGNRLTVPRDAEVTRLDALAPYTADEPPAPANAAAPDETEAPQPIGGQPAHWARVDDLAPGDTVRMTGTTRRGRHVQRAGYVYNPPVRVEVTRRGRTEYMWRTWVTQNADGTGDAGNVYTSLNATAARAESPDDVVPGSPANGAQSALLAGDLPDTIPADREGRGMFPGSTVTNTNDREGTVTGATTNTVVVNWADSRDDTTESPTGLTVTAAERPDGWTTAGQRVRPNHVVSDNEGALLGPVDEVDGDRVTVTTADGPVTRSAGELQVTGEVRDDVPAPDPVADIDELTAADLKDGDTLALDEDGLLSLVEVVGNPRRNGDRVTFEWVWPITGDMAESEVDASTVFQRTLGPNGGRPDLGPDDAPEPPDDMTVHEPARQVDPVTGPTVDPGLTTGDRTVISDHADGPDNNPDAQQAAARITADLPVTPEQATALAAHLRESADPSTGEGRAALRAADHLDQAAGRTPPPGLNRPRPSNAAQLTDGDIVAMPDERQNDQVHVFRVLDIEEGPGGVRRLLLEDENQKWRRRIVHGAMPVWQLPEAQPDPVTPPDIDPEPNTPTAPTASVPRTAPATPSAPAAPVVPVARLLPGVLRAGDMIDAPTSRSGYQFNGHRRLTLISAPHRNGWWMQLTGIDEDGNVHDFGLHSGRAVNVYERNRPTPGLPPTGEPRDPNPAPGSDLDRLVRDHGRSLSVGIINEAIAGTDPAGTIHALREQIAQRLTPDALRPVRAQTRQDGMDALDASGITGPARDAARKELKQARRNAHAATVRAALRTINDLEPLPGESEEDLAARARDLLRLIPDGVAARQARRGGDGGIADAVAGHADRAMSALLQQLQDAGVDPGDAEQLARMLTRQLSGSRNDTARRIARRVAAASPDAAQRPGLIAGILALLIRMAKRLVELVKAGARKIAEKWQGARERLARLRAFFGRLVRRVRQWPESRRLTRLQRAVDLPEADGDSLAARVTHWAALMPEPGHFGQTNRRVTWWRPTTWGQLAAGQLPDRSDRIQWAPDQAADGGPGLTALRHMAALRAAGGDVDQDVTRRLASSLGDDFGDDPHATLQEADEHVADSERRLVNLQAARSGATIPDDPDLEVEITAARAEVTGARNEYEILRARYTAAVPDAVAAALAEIRDMGPDGSTSLVFGPDTDPDAERAVRGVQRLVPRSWLDDAPVRRVTAVNGDTGRYEPQGQRITVADLADDGLGTAGHALAQHLAQHLGDLDAAQRAFWFTQTHTGRPGARRMRQTALGRLLARQQRTQPETGDTLARSVQSMFNGDWYQDDDLRQFLLGLLATR